MAVGSRMLCQAPNKQLQRTVMDKVPSHLDQPAAETGR
jgi:hypothetical protein